MAIIDYRDARPIYEQIASYYKGLILRGILEEDEQMPSVRSLAMELSTNPNTVQRAYAELERGGYLYTVKGRGNFVSNNGSLILQHKADLLGRMRGLRREAEELSLDADELWRETTDD